MVVILPSHRLRAMPCKPIAPIARCWRARLCCWLQRCSFHKCWPVCCQRGQHRRQCFLRYSRAWVHADRPCNPLHEPVDHCAALIPLPCVLAVAIACLSTPKSAAMQALTSLVALENYHAACLARFHWSVAVFVGHFPRFEVTQSHTARAPTADPVRRFPY